MANAIQTEFERLAEALMGSMSRANADDGSRTPGAHSLQTRPIISADVICECALELVDREGLSALTVRRLASDLHISTRTLYKRMGSREHLLRGMSRMYVTRLPLEPPKVGSWDERVVQWCFDLYDNLLAHPHLTSLLKPDDSSLIESYMDGLVEIMLSEGMSRDLAYGCCRSLFSVTVGDAMRRLQDITDRAMPDAGDCTQRGAPMLSDTVKWIIEGVRAEAAG